ncbi:ATP-dependent helicase C-terminal domain-containing protein [Reinekea marina]|uniref:ATP-dependent helicase C-terminal domain-containing protein n=1 Tax=Reinekea marina TaxID=1310421 RepID=A0ABV7WNI3_9GAMM|nr:ATP-dependent helicase C-terminal domain-containing protein [Reinekea marina]MDN3649925.1 ATP-dependent helicase C-terminal domain-containing protein [Reinekea marina]
MPQLPIESIKSEVLSAWQAGGCIVSAPPGSGKSTQLPLWGLALPFKKTFLLIPKRIAVKLAANQLANNLNQKVGETVGYQLRQDQCLSNQTRIVVTSYGSFLQMLLNNPESVSNCTVIMDEFHERALDQDVSFALIQETIALLDEPVPLIIMSATLEVEQLQKMTEFPLIASPGFSYPIDIEYQKLDLNRSTEFAHFIEKIWQNSHSHLLVFLAGLKEIRAIERTINNTIPVMVLHGQLNNTPNLEQLNTVEKTVILATNIAESSVTLANVHTVIDSGLERFATTHPITGISALKTRRISQASATQRAGRAGRLGPGKVFRLWSEDEHQSRVPYQPAEITQADLTLSLLQLALWGTRFDQASWLTQPDKNRVETAEQKCEQWGALKDGHITQHGEAMLATGLDPALANFVVTAEHYECLPAAIVFAATLSVDPAQLAQNLKPTSMPNQLQIRNEVKRLAKRLKQDIPPQFKPLDSFALVKAFQQRLIYSPTNGAPKLFNGASVSFMNANNSEWSLMLEGHQQDRSIRVFHALPIDADTAFKAIKVNQTVQFRPSQRQEFWRIETVGQIVIKQEPFKANPEEKTHAWENYIANHGESALPINSNLLALKQRWQIATKALNNWPKWPDASAWLGIAQPFLTGLNALADLDTVSAFKHWAGYEQLATLDQLCPKLWQCPSGRSVPLAYQPQHSKVVAQLKLQEAFGLNEQPTVANNLAITLELTAPNGRPVATVHDLPHFWRNIYPEVRKELRGRYAKHPWPEDPIGFKATAKTNRQLRAT